MLYTFIYQNESTKTVVIRFNNFWNLEHAISMITELLIITDQ